MRRFKFSLESVLIIRQKKLEDERIALAKIINVLNKQTDVLNEMLYVYNSFVQQRELQSFEENVNPMIIANYGAYCSKMVDDIKTQEKIISLTQKDIERQQQVVKEAYINVKSLENLKEKQKEEYNQEQLQEEIKIIDDIVNSKRSA